MSGIIKVLCNRSKNMPILSTSRFSTIISAFDEMLLFFHPYPRKHEAIDSYRSLILTQFIIKLAKHWRKAQN